MIDEYYFIAILRRLQYIMPHAIAGIVFCLILLATIWITKTVVNYAWQNDPERVAEMLRYNRREKARRLKELEGENARLKDENVHLRTRLRNAIASNLATRRALIGHDPEAHTAFTMITGG